MSLLARAWPDEFAVRVTAARELSQILGDDHDLAMLIAATVKAADMSPEQKEAIVELCLRRQHALRAAAQFRAERLFAEAPRAFLKRMKTYWKAGGLVRTDDIATPARQSRNQPTEVTAAPAPEAASGAKPAVSRPRLAAKAATAAPSQRRA
jgi:hypothetical protein